VRLWDVKNGNAISVLEGHANIIRSVSFSSAGNKIATGSCDNTIRIWSTDTGKCIQEFSETSGQIYSVMFAPNESYIVGAGSAGRLQFWDVNTGESFLYRYSFAPGSWLTILPDGRFDASPEGLRKLAYTDNNLYYFSAEDFIKEFFRPDDVQEVINNYCGNLK